MVIQALAIWEVEIALVVLLFLHYMLCRPQVRSLTLYLALKIPQVREK